MTIKTLKSAFKPTHSQTLKERITFIYPQTVSDLWQMQAVNGMLCWKWKPLNSLPLFLAILSLW